MSKALEAIGLGHRAAEFGALEGGVGLTPEVLRVRDLPARAPTTDELIDSLSAGLRLNPDSDLCPECFGIGHNPEGITCKVCGGTGRIRLRPHQAEALYTYLVCGGLFGAMRVGSGKTLVTLLAATLLGAQRPVLIAPAALVKGRPGKPSKTRRDYAIAAKAWRVKLPRLFSFEELGHPKAADRLISAVPDLLILDEAHKARNRSAAVTRRIGRTIDLLKPKVAVLSGTLVTDRLLDYWHLAKWSLGDKSPIARTEGEVTEWAQAVDANVGTLTRTGLGELGKLPGGSFHEHMRSRLGVVSTPKSDCDAGLEFGWWKPELSAVLQAAIEMTATSGMRPDGELLDEMEIPDVLCQIAQGFYYIWDPMPPEWWLTPRRAYFAYIRAVLDEHIEDFDSPSMVRDALLDPTRTQPPAANEGRQLLAAWQHAKQQPWTNGKPFEPNPVPVWLDDSPLQQAIKWAKKGSIVWVKHRAAGQRLQELGLRYYGGGTNPEGHKPGAPMAASIAAHGTGKNLQHHWHRNLVLTPPANPDMWEQLTGRTHRAGQRETVRFDLIDAIEYHRNVVDRVITRAKNTGKASGETQKLIEATWI